MHLKLHNEDAGSIKNDNIDIFLVYQQANHFSYFLFHVRFTSCMIYGIHGMDAENTVKAVIIVICTI